VFPERSSVIEVTATYDSESGRHLFVTDTDTDTVEAGWTTIRFTNASPMLHFVLLDHLPEGHTSADLRAEISPIFQEAMDLVRAGRPDDAAARFGELPDWYVELTFRGGPGFTSPGRVAETVLYLEPGDYMLECYIKTEDGVFHWGLGMYADLHVLEDVNGAQPPVPTLQVTLTDSTMVVEGDPVAGEHVVAVHFQQEHPGLLGKDLHVARLDAGIDPSDVVAWMDANQTEGLVSTAARPAPATFLGGAQDMPLGSSAYFRLTLEPGNYLWVSELPLAEASFEPFTVPGGR